MRPDEGIDAVIEHHRAVWRERRLRASVIAAISGAAVGLLVGLVLWVLR
ncbi:MAG: hypothetical protein IT529_06255 [Burkholderiales bacterium]|nr:hypothetical protein [Burkholderiales bacterium]